MKFANFLNVPPGLILVAAALLKGYQVIDSPIAFGEFWNSSLIGILVLVTEFIVGWFLLLPSLLGNWTKYIGIAVFSLFVVYTLWAALLGETSCGCLGMIEIPLSVMLLVDLGMLGSLLAWRVPLFAINPRTTDTWTTSYLLVFSALIGVSFALYVSKVEVKNVEAPEIAEGDFIYIRPDDWLGKRFPLARYVECNEVFSGDWTVVFYNEGCSKCKNLFENIYARNGLQRFLLVKVVSTSENRIKDSEHIKWRSLPNTHEWFVESPKIVEVSEGIVQSVK
jgi:hypothetical protein